MKIIRTLSLFLFAAFIAVAVSSCQAGADKALETSMDEINKELAAKNLPGFEKVYMTTEPGYVVYNYIVDESLIDIDAMKGSAAEQEQVMKDEITNTTDGDMKAFITLVKTADRGIKFLYKGNKSGDSFEYVIENDEF